MDKFRHGYFEPTNKESNGYFISTKIGNVSLGTFNMGQLIDNLLSKLFALLPKMCVPIKAFKKLERDNIEMADMIQSCVNENKALQI